MNAPFMSQSPIEIDGFIGILKREGVTRFLEVGSRFGGSLWRIALSLPKGSLIVSCDSGKGMGGRKPGAMRSLETTIERLKHIGYDAHLIVGHSQTGAVIREVWKHGPYDAVFIDGDHEYDGVKADWKHFGRNARIAGFHDVAWKMPAGYDNSKMVGVPQLWAELKAKHRHEEFIDPAFNYGIGVVWP